MAFLSCLHQCTVTIHRKTPWLHYSTGQPLPTQPVPSIYFDLIWLGHAWPNTDMTAQKCAFSLDAGHNGAWTWWEGPHEFSLRDGGYLDVTAAQLVAGCLHHLMCLPYGHPASVALFSRHCCFIPNIIPCGISPLWQCPQQDWSLVNLSIDCS